MQAIAWFAALLVFMSFFMKTIVPLRMLAIASNVVFIGYALMGLQYGVFDKVLPIFVLHLSLLPLNIVRLRQVNATIRSLGEVKAARHSLDLLIPYMKHQEARKGQVIFRKGDETDYVYLIRQGRVTFPEVGRVLVPGDFFGEVGVFSRHHIRTSTAVCEEDCVLFSIAGEKVVELFYQDPRFGFMIVRALAGYLSEGVDDPRERADVRSDGALKPGTVAAGAAE